MTLIKSLLLGSAAGIVAVASAQAADLPTRKAAPVEYVKVCNVGGITGWTLPGSDTCVKFSGYITAQFEGGNLNTQYNYGTRPTAGALALAHELLTGGATGGSSGIGRRVWTVQPARSGRGKPSQRTDFLSSLRQAGRPAPTSASTWPRTPPMAP